MGPSPTGSDRTAWDRNATAIVEKKQLAVIQQRIAARSDAGGPALPACREVGTGSLHCEQASENGRGLALMSLPVIRPKHLPLSSGGDVQCTLAHGLGGVDDDSVVEREWRMVHFLGNSVQGAEPGHASEPQRGRGQEGEDEREADPLKHSQLHSADQRICEL